MQLSSEILKDVLCIQVQDSRIDAAIAVHFKDAVRDITTQHSGRVLLDLKDVAFIDSSGLGALVALMKTLPNDQKLELCGLTEIVARVIQLTRMDGVFVIHPDRSSALCDGRSAA